MEDIIRVWAHFFSLRSVAYRHVPSPSSPYVVSFSSVSQSLKMFPCGVERFSVKTDAVSYVTNCSFFYFVVCRYASVLGKRTFS